MDKTVKAAELLMSRLEELGMKRALFYLDQQVSNSGRLRALLLEKAAGRAVEIQVEAASRRGWPACPHGADRHRRRYYFG